MRRRTVTGRRRTTAAWRALLNGFADSELTVPAYCARAGISAASFYRWRALLGAEPQRQAVKRARAGLPQPTEFVDLGALATPTSRLELRLDLGGGMLLQIARG